MDKFFAHIWLKNYIAATMERLSQSSGEQVFDSSLQRELESVMMSDAGIDPSRIITESKNDVD